ncbi:MAG: hypothetical protein V3R98_13860 [Alphaproteobacteria bacterium]
MARSHFAQARRVGGVGRGDPNPTAGVLFNGALDVWQRGTTFPSIANDAVGPDRFRYVKTGTMVHDLLRSTDVPTQAQAGIRANYSLHLDCTTADASIAAGDQCFITTRPEGYDILELVGNDFILPFWVKGTKTGIHCVSFRNSTNDRSYVVEYTIDTTATWEFKLIRVPAGLITAGTWDYTNGIGLTCSWILAAGTTFHTTADAWQTGNFLATVNQVNACDSSVNDFRIALPRLHRGLDPLRFERRPFVRELGYCQRYYVKTFDYNIAPVQNSGSVSGILTYRAFAAGGQNATVLWNFPTPLRAASVATFYNPSQANASWYNVNRAAASGVASAESNGENMMAVRNPQVAADAIAQELRIHASVDVEL